jgi:hypothetical protein
LQHTVIIIAPEPVPKLYQGSVSVGSCRGERFSTPDPNDPNFVKAHLMECWTNFSASSKITCRIDDEPGSDEPGS